MTNNLLRDITDEYVRTYNKMYGNSEGFLPTIVSTEEKMNSIRVNFSYTGGDGYIDFKYDEQLSRKISIESSEVEVTEYLKNGYIFCDSSGCLFAKESHKVNIVNMMLGNQVFPMMYSLYNTYPVSSYVLMKLYDFDADNTKGVTFYVQIIDRKASSLKDCDKFLEVTFSTPFITKAKKAYASLLKNRDGFYHSAYDMNKVNKLTLKYIV